MAESPSQVAELPTLLARTTRTEWRFFPHSPSQKQIAFLLSPALETFYGGAAGGGKTDAQLMRALLFADEPGYHAAIFRKTCPELTGSSGLIERSKDWLMRFSDGPTWNESKMTWSFPSGSRLSFGYCERDDDARAYQGHEWQYLGIDEVTTWNRWPVMFLRSRVRRTVNARVPLGIGLTGNPGGIGHEWVRERYIENATRDPDAVTIRAWISDNPGLSREEYEATLSALPPVLRAQLMRGDWTAIDEGALIGREHLVVVEATPADAYAKVRFWDCAATKEDGCYTVGLLMSKNRAGLVTIEDVVRGQWNAGEVEHLIEQTARMDGVTVAIDWEEEPGSAGISVSDSRRRRLAGFTTYGTKATGPKWVRAQPFASYARAGNVRVFASSWTRAYVDELTSATPDLKGYMDQVDATSGAFTWITTAAHVPKVRDDGVRTATQEWWQKFAVSGRRVHAPFRTPGR